MFLDEARVVGAIENLGNGARVECLLDQNSH